MNLLVHNARRLIGVPWIHQGRSVHGVDCIGLVVLAEIACGREVPDRADYPALAFDDTLRLELEAFYGAPVVEGVPAVGDLREGDKLLIRLGRHQRHVAIVTRLSYGPLGMLHAYDGGLRQVTENALDDEWRGRIEAVFR